MDMTDVATGLRAAADSLACARFLPSELDLAHEFVAVAMADLSPDLVAQVERALRRGDHRRLDELAIALEPPGAPTPEPKARRQRKPRIAPPDGPLTMAEAAARLGCSVKTLNVHISRGEIGYATLGKGKVRPRKLFAPSDLDAFIAAQTRKDSPCPSSATRARHTGASTSKSKVIAFSAVPRPRPGGKRKP